MSAARSLQLKTLRLAQEGRVLTVRTATPPLNFATPGLIADLDVLTRAVDRDASIGAVVLTGEANKRFLTHADPFALGGMIESPTPKLPLWAIEAMLRAQNVLFRAPGLAAVVERVGGDVGAGLLWGFRWKRTILRMNRSSTVYLAAINGPTLGGGHELVLACDLRYAADAEHVRLGQVESTANLIPGGGGTQRLPRILGTARALEHMLEGRSVGAREALELGLVHHLVDEADLLAATQETAARLARRSPTVVAAIKRSVYFATDRRFSRGLDYEQAGFFAAGSTATMLAVYKALRDDMERLGDTPLLADHEPWVDGTRVDQVGAA